MWRYARRSRLVALGLSVAALLGLVTAMVATEHARPVAPAPAPAAVASPDPFTAGGPATPPSTSPPARGFHQTITSAS